MKSKSQKVSRDDRICYQYTEKHFVDAKLRSSWAIVIFIIAFILFFLLFQISAFVALPVCAVVAGIAFKLSKGPERWKTDRIYIKDDVLFYEEHLGACFRRYIFRDITGVEVGSRYFTVRGNILMNINGKTAVYIKFKLPMEIVNIEELLQFLRSKVISEDARKEALSMVKDRRAKETGITHREIWNVVKLALTRFMVRVVLAGAIGLIIALVMYLRFFDEMWSYTDKMSFLLVYFVMFGSAAVSLGALGYCFVFGLFYYSDFVSKNVYRYTGYFSNLQPAVARYEMWNPVKQFEGYQNALFYHTPGEREPYYSSDPGDIFSDPFEGRRFLIKDAELLDGISKNRKIEVLYLPKTKIVVKIKVIN